jgi:hypothetical protein
MGTAKTPKLEQRTAFINYEPFPMDPDHYDCDNCMKPIKPGDPCAAWTVWTADMQVPPEWEREFMEYKNE